MKQENEFKESNLFDYNFKKKKTIAIFQISLISIILILVVLYLTLFKDLNFINSIEIFFKLIYSEISKGTILGAIYTALFGGLFFITLPMELLYINFLRSNNNPILLIVVFVLFLCISYGLDYLIGLKFAKLVKHLITPEKFYKTKGFINRYGKIGIFIFNALPLPSQQLTAILGVFKYNKARFYFYFITGQITKYIIITLAVIYFI